MGVFEANVGGRGETVITLDQGEEASHTVLTEQGLARPHVSKAKQRGGVEWRSDTTLFGICALRHFHPLWACEEKQRFPIQLLD